VGIARPSATRVPASNKLGKGELCVFVSDILKLKDSEVVTTGPDETVDATARLLSRRRIGAVVVVDMDNAVIGIISERDVVRGIATKGEAVLDTPVRALMTADVVTCTTGETIAGIMKTMTDHRFRHMPVVEDGVLKGMISIGDVVKHRLEETEMEAQALRDYVLAAH
jgi:CBS domain-containing protein